MKFTIYASLDIDIRNSSQLSALTTVYFTMDCFLLCRDGRGVGSGPSARLFPSPGLCQFKIRWQSGRQVPTPLQAVAQPSPSFRPDERRSGSRPPTFSTLWPIPDPDLLWRRLHRLGPLRDRQTPDGCQYCSILGRLYVSTLLLLTLGGVGRILLSSLLCFLYIYKRDRRFISHDGEVFLDDQYLYLDFNRYFVDSQTSLYLLSISNVTWRRINNAERCRERFYRYYWFWRATTLNKRNNNNKKKKNLVGFLLSRRLAQRNPLASKHLVYTVRLISINPWGVRYF